MLLTCCLLLSCNTPTSCIIATSVLLLSCCSRYLRRQHSSNPHGYRLCPCSSI
nr:MAG TPA: glycosyltransferase family protein [Caudoviricetes sp.]